jgi:hypothetical protein
MTLDTALFLVDRTGTTYHSKGQDIGTKMLANDRVLVQRGDEHFRATYNGSSWDKIQDSDLVLAWDGTNNRKVTGANFKALFVPPGPPPIGEWTWQGHSSDSENYHMCDVRRGTAFTWTANTVTYLAQTDKNGVFAYAAVKYAYDNNGMVWYKYNNSPAVLVTRSLVFSGPYCYFTHSATNLSTETSATGVLRCYNYDPDAA